MDKENIFYLDSFAKEFGLDSSGEYTDEGKDGNNFYSDVVSYSLVYKDNRYELSMSVYHASEDNNANNPDAHTEEIEEVYDSLDELADAYPKLIVDVINSIAF